MQDQSANNNGQNRANNNLQIPAVLAAIQPNNAAQVSTKRPSQKSISRLAKRIAHDMYARSHQNRVITYETHDIFDLLNQIPFEHASVPLDIQFKWGQAIQSMGSIRDAVKQIGVRGEKVVMQNKEAIFASAMVLDENNTILNKDLLSDIAPHKSYHGRADWIAKCKSIRTQFDQKQTKMLCTDTKHKRNKTKATIKDSMRQYWLDHSEPSPSKHDTVIMRSHDGNRIKLANNKWQHGQKRFYQKDADDMYEDWKTLNSILIVNTLLNLRKKCPCLRTFESYKPHHVRKGDDPLSQMSCDKCTEFEYLYIALFRVLKNECQSPQK